MKYGSSALNELHPGGRGVLLDNIIREALIDERNVFLEWGAFRSICGEEFLEFPEAAWSDKGPAGRGIPWKDLNIAQNLKIHISLRDSKREMMDIHRHNIT